jgi:hypothetical protein
VAVSTELAQRLDAFVAARARELAAGGGAPRSGAAVVFADELAARPAAERGLLRAALEQAASDSAWDLARSSGRDPAAAMRRALERLLAA